MKGIKTFISSSNTFNGFVFNGLYTMNNEDFFNMFYYYKKTGINLLDNYSDMIYLQWIEFDGNMYVDNDLIIKYENSQSILRHSRIFSYDWLADCRIKIKQLKVIFKKQKERLQNEPRISACRHTSKYDVRKSVFDKYGKMCLCCGSIENLTIDHVVPVLLGGKNNIKNYQPLCKSCNSKKGIKIIDYRNKS